MGLTAQQIEEYREAAAVMQTHGTFYTYDQDGEEIELPVICKVEDDEYAGLIYLEAIPLRFAEVRQAYNETFEPSGATTDWQYRRAEAGHGE